MEEGNTKALSPTAMFNMGLKVAGQSGEAKLKVKINIIYDIINVIYV